MPGRYFEEIEVGEAINHHLRRTITEGDNTLFCGMTMNTQPLHLDAEFGRESPFGARIVNGILTMGLVVGITVPELTEGTIVANLSYDRVVHPAPVFHGDTIRVETEVLSKRESRSRQDRGIIKLLHRGYKQDGTLVVEVERSVLFLRRERPAPEAASTGDD